MTYFRFALLFALSLMPLVSQSKNPQKVRELDLQLSAQGGFRIVGKTTVYEGNVTVELPGLLLMTADQTVYDSEAGVIVASGNVKIDYYSKLGLIEVTAQEATYQDDGTAGSFKEVTVQFGEEFYFVGSSLEMLESGQVFLIHDGLATSCNQANPQWSLRIDKATIQKEGYAFIRGARFKIKNLPLIYFPYLVIPAMQERRSGLLRPDTGSSERNGTYFSMPFFWAPRQDVDFTFVPSYFKKAGMTLEVEARYKPRLDLSGLMLGTVFRDRVIEGLKERSQSPGGSVPMENGKPLSETRHRVFWEHRQSLRGGHLQAQVEAGSDFSVDRDYLQDAPSTRIRDYYYRGSFDKNFGANTLILNVNRLERILSTQEKVQTVNELPGLRLYQPNRPMGRGFYLRNYLYANFFDFEELGANKLSDRLLRVGLDSEVSRTQNWSRYIHSRWGLRYQGAFYRMDHEGESSTRGGLISFLETVGPRFQKSYSTRKGRRLVHYLDASLAIKAGKSEKEPFLDTILFDELDIRIADQVDGIESTWKINSRVFAGPVGKVRPLLELEISQDIDVDGQETQPIKSRFRLLNLAGFHANGILDYNPKTNSIDTLSLFSSVNRGQWTGYGGFVRRRVEESENRESFIGISSWAVPRLRSKFKIALDYDFEKKEFKSQEFSYRYQGQCLGVNLSYVKSPFDSSSFENRDFFRITVSLRNLAENLGSKF